MTGIVCGLQSVSYLFFILKHILTSVEVVHSCSIKKITETFCKIYQINLCWSPFLTSCRPRSCNCIKVEVRLRCSSLIFVKFNACIERFYRFTLRLFYCCFLFYYKIYWFITFAKQKWGRINFSYSSGIVYPYLSIRTGKSFYVQCLFDCSLIVLSPLYR